MGIHLNGAGEALKIMFGITAVASIALVVFIVAMLPHFDSARLFDIPVSSHAGASRFYRLAIWEYGPQYLMQSGFLAVEGVPLAAEEAKDPVRSLPRGLIGSMLILASFALLILFLGAGAAGSNALKNSGAPLVDALIAVYGQHTWLASFVNFVGLAGLVASFFSIIYAYSRQIFALSRAGYLPKTYRLPMKIKRHIGPLLFRALLAFTLFNR